MQQERQGGHGGVVTGGPRYNGATSLSHAKLSDPSQHCRCRLKRGTRLRRLRHEGVTLVPKDAGEDVLRLFGGWGV
jgi:hypothetical protein